jgi:HPt (histidine-containing phosphotransfer) domain-containing protein
MRSSGASSEETSCNKERVMEECPKTTATTHLIDCGYIAELIEAIGGDDYRTLVASFKDEAEAQVVTMQAKRNAGDIEGVKHSAHRLAGLLSQFGAFEVVGLAERIRECDSPDDIGELARSEERRVGKECRRLCRSRWSPYH